MNKEIRIQILLAVQSSLLGYVTANVRGVTCGVSGQNIKIKVFFDGEMSDIDRDAMDDMATEVASHFKTELVDLECIRSDAPQPYINNGLELWAYRRKEK